MWLQCGHDVTTMWQNSGVCSVEESNKMGKFDRYSWIMGTQSTEKAYVCGMWFVDDVSEKNDKLTTNKLKIGNKSVFIWTLFYIMMYEYINLEKSLSLKKEKDKDPYFLEGCFVNNFCLK